MIGHNEEVELSIKVSYYYSYSEFALKGGRAYWPFFLAFFLLILSGWIDFNSSVTIFLLFFCVFVGFFCAFETRFYANSYLMICEDGLEIKGKNRTLNYSWSDISKVEYLIPLHGLSYLEIIMVVYTNDNNIEYIFIENLYFNSAKSRVKVIKLAVNTYFKSDEFAIKKSDFRTNLLNKKLGPPNVRS
jgi:hypothetical protein